jgi:FeS assembly SUF system protein
MGYITGEDNPTNLLGLAGEQKELREMAEINQAEVMDALHECYDPEIPVNIVDLGLVYNVDTNDETGHVDITMTLTALGCPMAGEVMEEVQMRVEQVENVKSCKVELTFDPPWSPDRMTEDAKWELGMV